MLTIRQLHASAGGKEILRGIDLEVGAGEVHAVMGPNGSGKSTLAQVLAGHPAYEVRAGAVRFAGRNISTLEVESVVRRHPAVADVAAFGIPSAELASEDELKIDVVLKDGAGLTPEALCSFINDNAPYFFVPRYIEITDDLPHTPTGRVQKFQLRDRGVGPNTWDRVAAGFEVTR